MTMFVRAASRPNTTRPGVIGNWPRLISINAMAGCRFGTGACPTMNCARKSNGTCEPGATGALPSRQLDQAPARQAAAEHPIERFHARRQGGVAAPGRET